MNACVCVCVRTHLSERDSVLKMHWIELKFQMQVIGLRWTNPIDFSVSRMYSLFTGVKKKEFFYITANGIKLLKVL